MRDLRASEAAANTAADREEETAVTPPKFRSLQLDPLKARCAACSAGLLRLCHAAAARAPLMARARLRREPHRAAVDMRTVRLRTRARPRHYEMLKQPAQHVAAAACCTTCTCCSALASGGGVRAAAQETQPRRRCRAHRAHTQSARCLYAISCMCSMLQQNMK